MTQTATGATLFKRTQTGAVQEWFIEIHENGDAYRTVSGQQGGQMVRSGWKEAQPKNVGRANETTAQQQCDLEVAAKYTKKLAQGGYHASQANVDKPKFFKPMLAQNFDKVPVDFETQDVFSQPKFDGIRCVADQFGLWTRMGKPLVATPHVHQALAPLFEQNPDLIFDDELYADKQTHAFNKIISATGGPTACPVGKTQTSTSLPSSRSRQPNGSKPSWAQPRCPAAAVVGE